MLTAFSICFTFSQRFAVAAVAAYEWSTDYRPDDFSLMGIKGKREIRKITENTLILTDTTYQDGKPVKRQRLVKLNPIKLSWSNTHITGPNKHSQFLYQIISQGSATSRLDFTGLQVNCGRTTVAPAAVASLERKAKENDSGIWKRLAVRMEKEIGPKSKN